MSQTKFFTNEGQNTLLKRFAGVFEHLPNIAQFDALVGYFRASGYFALRPHLDQVPQIRVLVGINVDQLTAKYHRQGLLFSHDPEQTIAEVKDKLIDDIQSSAYQQEVEQGILQFIDDIISGKLILKAHPSRNLHAKIYIFRPANFNEYASGEVITGSSNLTESGLGSRNKANYEFNVALRDYADVKFATDEFEKLWREGVDILPTELQQVKANTYLNDQITPYELYLKFLLEYFGPSVTFDPSTLGDLPKGFKPLSYQADAVEQGYALLIKHNGFFLADVVGLGKTVIATQIAKKFFYFNGYPQHVSRILVVTPPALRSSWQETLNAFGLKSYRLINNGSLHKLSDLETYDLVLIDEAHKFRNDISDAYNDLQKICKASAPRLLPHGQQASKKVILISATPLNNRPADIRNLVFLFQDGKRSTLEISNLTHFFNTINKAYREAEKLDLESARVEVARLYEAVRQKVIMPLTVRRTRTDLRAHAQYQRDLDKQGVIFPQVNGPYPILYQLEPSLEQLYDETIWCLKAPPEQGGLAYLRYQALAYLVAHAIKTQTRPRANWPTS